MDFYLLWNRTGDRAGGTYPAVGFEIRSSLPGKVSDHTGY